MRKIADFEALAQRMVEGTFARLFAGRLSPLEVATKLATAVEEYRATYPDSLVAVPSRYEVYVNPSDLSHMQAQEPNLEAELAKHVSDLVGGAGFVSSDPVRVSLIGRHDVSLHEVQVRAGAQDEVSPAVEKTREIAPVRTDQLTTAEEVPSGRPFLILDGRRHFDLRQPIVGLGRGVENDVILEDPRVSRRHAQLRLRYGRYVLYDLGSTGGTEINGYPVRECVLHSGDVISFAGVQVIYAEDPPTPVPSPKSGDTPTMYSGEET
jgi:hypothetical protein